MVAQVRIPIRLQRILRKTSPGETRGLLLVQL